MVVTLKFYGSNCLRQRLVLSLLTGKPVNIDAIRPDEYGLNSYEENLLDLVQKITSGTKVQITAGNTKLHFIPGTIIGGEVTHDCDLNRSISYYLELILCLSPFSKKAFQLTLNGVTNDQVDPNVDALKASTLPVIKRFIGEIEDSKLDIKINARGFQPNGGGKIVFTCPIVRQLKPVQLSKSGKVKRIRGIAVAARVSPQMANRMIDTSKGMMLDFIPDIYIYSDHTKGKTSGQSPGFSISLCAETTEGCFYSASAVSNSKGSGKGPSVPEDVAKEATYSLFGEISRAGCVDSISQCVALTLMAFNQKDISQLTMGSLSSYSINYLRHLKEFCGLTFRLEASELSQNEIIVTCEGIGYKNMSRATY